MAAGGGTGFTQAVRDVEDSVFEYLQRGLAEYTRKSYQSGIKHFLAFCTKYNLIATPVSESTRLLFMASLGKEGLSYKTIKLYLSAVRHLHVSYGLLFNSSPRILLLLRGIHRSQGEISRPRLPITPDTMRILKRHLAVDPNRRNNRMYWAAANNGFFGFLRFNEF